MKVLGLFLFALVFPMLAFSQTNKAANASNQFGLDMYQLISKGQGNLFFSPLSIETCLAMAASGAQHETLKQMLSTLHLDPTDSSEFKSLLDGLKGNKEFQLAIANRIWGQAGTPYDPEFVKTLVEKFNADMVSLDFHNQSEASRKQINQWVEEQTKGKIKDLLQPGTITIDTDLVLTNAVYFKGSWTQAFKKELTKDDEFHMSSYEKRNAPFMHKKGRLKYTENKELQYLELPYKGNELVMDVLLPKEGVGLKAIEKNLHPKLLADLIQEASMDEVDLSLPKFKAESLFDLGGNLSKLGMPLAFDRTKADFHGMKKMKPPENLSISKVIHKSYVDVNEEGTEAAAATGAVMFKFTSLPAPPKVFKANRPFLYFIRHVKTGAILFMGRFSEP